IGARGVVCASRLREPNLAEGDVAELGRREMLEQLQRRMDLDFLRSHGLNKSLERLLKSLSKAQVLAAWEAAQIAQADGRPPRPKRRKTRPADALLATVKAQLARLPKDATVAILHEECQADLDLFDLERPSASLPTAVLFVLGAVRDMLSSELHAVEAAAAELNLKLVRVRLGATPEFSSKVVRCLAAADLHGLVLPAVAKAVATQGLRELPEAPPLDFTVLHCCELPSSALCEDGTPRGRLLTLLQLCVCTLWRSKISSALSSEGDAAETCRRTVPHLRILFRDGVTLAVGSKFVEGMSSSHRAAPTERQLLDALRERLETKAKQRPSAAAGGEGEQWRQGLRSSLKRFESTTALFLSDEGVDLFAATTSVVAPRASRRRVERLLLIAPGDGLAAATRRLCDEELGAVVAVSLAPSAPSAVVMLQFMHYCGSVQRQRSHRLCPGASGTAGAHHGGDQQSHLPPGRECAQHPGAPRGRSAARELRPGGLRPGGGCVHVDGRLRGEPLGQERVGVPGRGRRLPLLARLRLAAVRGGLQGSLTGGALVHRVPNAPRPAGLGAHRLAAPHQPAACDRGAGAQGLEGGVARLLGRCLRLLGLPAGDLPLGRGLVHAEAGLHRPEGAPTDGHQAGRPALGPAPRAGRGGRREPHRRRLLAAGFCKPLLGLAGDGELWRASGAETDDRGKAEQLFEGRERTVRTETGDFSRSSTSSAVSSLRLETGWSEVCTRLARHGYVLPEPKRQKPRKEPKATLLGYTNKLKSLTAKVQELSMDFERLLPPLGEAR
ncbi:Uncharacterized protein SCF082_LOCUS34038, partial [Durusdinium trenchii]